MDRTATSPRFTRFAWSMVGYLVFVILFGAWVRITHSGAGCGSHWPTCHGDIVPLAPSVETIIEYTHRLTSGLLGPLGIALVVWSARRFGRSRVTWAASVTMVFIVAEALIGAGLVLGELVVDDDSVARAVVIAIHLVNTLVLTAAAALTAHWSRDHRPLARDRFREAAAIVSIGLVAIVITSMTGAITALGDTLFPVAESGRSSLLGDLSSANHFLIRLRIVHPVVAAAAAATLLWIGGWVASRGTGAAATRWARVLQVAVAIEVVVGGLNIFLAAPGWLQLLHLCLAQAVWLAAVLTMVTAWSADSAR